MDINMLKNITKNTPDTPGIYRFQNRQKKDIYIGKASSIKKRLASYILALSSSNGKTAPTPQGRGSDRSVGADPRIQKMIAVAEYLTYIKTNSDIEALILESQLIKQRRPQFNIMLRDDKQYFFVGFTFDDFPRIFLTHQPYSAGGRILSPRPGGPVPSVPPLRGSPSTTGLKNRPPAEFVGPFTDGAALKATLKYLRDIFPYCTCKQKHHNFCLNYHIEKCAGFCCIKNPEARSMNQELRKFKNQYKQNIKAIKNILSGKKNSLIKELKKEMNRAGKKHDFPKAIELRNKFERLEQVFKNARIIKSSSILKKHAPFLSGILHNTKPIIHIEGYDISNIQGKYATGAMVTFVNGLPDKNLYRKFEIRRISSASGGFGDTQMLAQILERRFSHPEWPFPDLILIDGGKGQLNAALTTLRESGITNYESRVIALSKDDRHKGHQIFISNKKRPIPLAKLSEVDRNLLLAVDVEAHRFAVSYYRKLHRRFSLKK